MSCAPWVPPTTPLLNNSTIVFPGTPGSPASCTPSPSTSSHTRPAYVIVSGATLVVVRPVDAVADAADCDAESDADSDTDEDSDTDDDCDIELDAELDDELDDENTIDVVVVVGTDVLTVVVESVENVATVVSTKADAGAAGAIMAPAKHNASASRTCLICVDPP